MLDYIYRGKQREILKERVILYGFASYFLGIAQKLTDEEVSISKEKKICLVCKTSLSKQIFLCSSCGVFYCVKCSEALSNLENVCRVCNTPFDENKPSNPFKSVEEKPSRIDEEFQKDKSYFEK